jgi:hypothetical protein
MDRWDATTQDEKLPILGKESLSVPEVILRYFLHLPGSSREISHICIVLVLPTWREYPMYSVLCTSLWAPLCSRNGRLLALRKELFGYLNSG